MGKFFLVYMYCFYYSLSLNLKHHMRTIRRLNKRYNIMCISHMLDKNAK